MGPKRTKKPHLVCQMTHRMHIHGAVSKACWYRRSIIIYVYATSKYRAWLLTLGLEVASAPAGKLCVKDVLWLVAKPEWFFCTHRYHVGYTCIHCYITFSTGDKIHHLAVIGPLNIMPFTHLSWHPYENNTVHAIVSQVWCMHVHLTCGLHMETKFYVRMTVKLSMYIHRIWATVDMGDWTFWTSSYNPETDTSCGPLHFLL